MPSRLAVGPISMIDRRPRFGHAGHPFGKLHRVAQVVAPVAGRRRFGHQLAGEIRRQRHLRRMELDAARRTASNSSSISSISGEWNACDTLSIFTCTPSAVNCAASASTASRVARDDRVLRPLMHRNHHVAAVLRQAAAATRSGGANTTAILPRRWTLCINRARSAISASPSSTLITPATQAAAYSPTLCPSTMSGSTPHDRHNSASAYSSANSAGCVYSRLMDQRPRIVGRRRAPGNSTSTSDSPSQISRSISSHASIASRNTGCDSYNPRPMPAYCNPWPGKQKRHLGPAKRADLRLLDPSRRAVSPARQLFQPLAKLRRIGRHHRRPMIEIGPPRVRRITHVGRIGIRMLTPSTPPTAAPARTSAGSVFAEA